MSRQIVTIPAALMKATLCDWDIDWRGQSAGDTNSGVSQIVFNRFPRWIGSPTLWLVGDEIRAWRAVRAMAGGRAGIYRVPMIDRDHMPVYRRGIPFSTEEYFSTGYGFEFDPFITAVGAAAAGATEIVVAEGEFEVQVGQFISHDDWPHVVTYVTRADGVATIGVQMPLRRAIPDGAQISLRATGLFEATDDTMGNPSFASRWEATPQLSFQEWITRP